MFVKFYEVLDFLANFVKNFAKVKNIVRFPQKFSFSQKLKTALSCQPYSYSLNFWYGLKDF